MSFYTSLAWRNLLHNRVRTGVAVAGVTFAIVLMFMQLGFLEAVKISATLIYDVLDFDICLHSRDYNHFTDPRSLPQIRLAQAEGVQGVQSAAPLLVGIFSWRNPQSGDKRAILALGVPEGPGIRGQGSEVRGQGTGVKEQGVFRDPAIQEAVDQVLVRPRMVLVDTRTRREFGPQDGRQFGERDLGVPVEVNGNELQIGGTFTRGAGLSAGGAMIVTRTEFLRCTPYVRGDEVHLGLIRIEPREDANEIVRRLRSVLPEDVEVKTRQQILQEELRHWVWETNYGLIFQSGVLVAVIVGTAIVYQVLASDVASQMPEYATLKAMGYGNQYLVLIMLQQSVILALISYAAGVAIAYGLYAVTAAGAQIPVRMTWQNLLLVLGLSVAMCTLSGIIAVRRAFRADPADLFQ